MPNSINGFTRAEDQLNPRQEAERVSLCCLLNPNPFTLGWSPHCAQPVQCECVKCSTGHTHTHTDREQHPRHRHAHTRQAKDEPPNPNQKRDSPLRHACREEAEQAFIYSDASSRLCHTHTHLSLSLSHMYLYLYRYRYLNRYTSFSLSIYIYVYIQTYKHMYIYIHIYIYIYICICIHICMYVCICIYITYICTWSPPSRDSKPYTLISQLVNDLNPCSKKKWRVQRACSVEHLNLYQVPFYLYWRSLLVRCPLAPY